MPTFLNVAGAGYDVQIQGAQRDENIYIGQRSRVFNGGLRSSVQAEKAQWNFLLPPLSQGAADTFRAAIANGTFVLCWGVLINKPLVGNASLCDVRVTSEQRIADAENSSYKLVLAIHIEEV